MTKSYHARHKSKLNKSLALILFVGVVSMGLLVTTFVNYIKVEERSSLESFQDTLLYDESKDKNVVTFDSTLGFNITYNKKQFAAVGYVIQQGPIKPTNPTGLTFNTYDKEDVLVKRDYSIANLYDARVKSRENVKTKNYSSTDLDVSTSIRKDFFDKRRAQYGPGLSDLDLVEKHFTPKANEDQSVEVVSKGEAKINGIKYKKVTYKIVNKKLIKSTSTTEAYYLVKNKKPFAIRIDEVDDEDQEFVTSLRDLISQISYGGEQQSAEYGTKNSLSGGKVSNKARETTVNIPKDLKYKTALEVVAKNQPATVRIAMVYCAKIILYLPSQQPSMSLDEACNGAIGSGSIISSKGHVSTNGHVVSMKPNDILLNGLLVPLYQQNNNQPLRQFLSYLADNNVLQRDAIDRIVVLVTQGDEETISSLAGVISEIPPQLIKANSQRYRYAVQLGKTPLSMTQSGAIMYLNYRKNEIVSADLIDKNFDIYNNTGEFTASDVAVLKMENNKSDFPITKLGSIYGLKKGDLVTAIGYPAFVDNGLDTKQKYTFPTATQGKVRKIEYDSESKERKVVSSSTPISGGNSGGPAFSQNGLVAGLNTYGFFSSNCKSGDCFGYSSVFRDIADLKVLLKKNNIEISGKSQLSETWSKGIDELSRSNFGEARRLFIEAKNQYPSFYLADSFIRVADKQIKIENEATALRIIMGLLGLVIVGVVIGTIVFVRKIITHNKTTPPPVGQVPYDPTPPQAPPIIPGGNYVQVQQPTQQPAATILPILQYPPAGVNLTDSANQSAPPANLPQNIDPPTPPDDQSVTVNIDHGRDN